MKAENLKLSSVTRTKEVAHLLQKLLCDPKINNLQKVSLALLPVAQSLR